ncbi:MAG: hypothetical protein R6V41_09020 [Desulfobacteraceae bacterium]
MLDISTGYNKYKFIGNEFLTWIWYLVENEEDILSLIKTDFTTLSLGIGNSLVLENDKNKETREKITIKGDKAGLEEGLTALKKGAVVTEMNLLLTIDEEEFKFTIKGESFNITGLKTPSSNGSEGDGTDELEGSVIQKAFLCERVFVFIDNLFNTYIEKRSSESFKSEDLQKIRNWVEAYN